MDTQMAQEFLDLKLRNTYPDHFTKGQQFVLNTRAENSKSNVQNNTTHNFVISSAC